jgi:hypothetical protein
MANKRVFISFAIEDKTTKNLFTGQAKNTKVPYEFVDMSAKKAWDSEWKTNCRSRIKGCDGMIILVSKNLKKAEGALWEVKCGKDEKLKLLGVFIDGATVADKPDEMFGINCTSWTWDNVKNFIESL